MAVDPPTCISPLGRSVGWQDYSRLISLIAREALSKPGADKSAAWRYQKCLKGKAKNLAEAIAAMGHSPTLLAQLSSVETEIGLLESRLNASNKPQQFASNIEELREFVARKAMDLTAVLRSDVATARRALTNHVQNLVLTPKESPDGDVLEVSGDVDLFGGDDRVMQVVARDGIGRPRGAENR